MCDLGLWCLGMGTMFMCQAIHSLIQQFCERIDTLDAWLSRFDLAELVNIQRINQPSCTSTSQRIVSTMASTARVEAIVRGYFNHQSHQAEHDRRGARLD